MVKTVVWPSLSPPRQPSRAQRAQPAQPWDIWLASKGFTKDPAEQKHASLPKNLVLESLPNELLFIIFGFCSNVDLVRLSLLCRRLHHLVLPVVFQSFGLTCPYEDLDIHCGGPSALPALRIALFFTSVRKLTLQFKSSNFFSDLQQVIRLVTKLTSVEELMLEFRGVWVHPSETLAFRESTQSHLDHWTYYMDRLLVALQGKGCVSLRASFGDAMIEYHNFPSKQLIGRLMTHIKEPHKRLAPRDWHPPALSTLQQLHIESPLFSSPPFLLWTLSSLQNSSQTITSLSLGPLHLLQAGWEHLLEEITLPNLSHLSAVASGPNFATLVKFLERHKIVVLRIWHPDARPAPRGRSRATASAFAHLKELHAPLEYIIPILKCSVPLPKLTTVITAPTNSWQPPTLPLEPLLLSLHMLCDAQIPPPNRLHVEFRAGTQFLRVFGVTTDDIPAGVDWTYPQIHSLKIELAPLDPVVTSFHTNASIVRGLANALERFTGLKDLTIGDWLFGGQASDNLIKAIRTQCPWVEAATILDPGGNVVGALAEVV